MAFIKKAKITSIGKDVEKRQHLGTVDKNVNQWSYYGTLNELSPKT
jgi:hypothetical protein